MKQVTISLEPDVATAFLKTKPQERKKLNHVVNTLLKNIFYRNKNAKQQLFDTMDEIGEQAQARGLTPEILDQILLEIKQEMKNEKR